MPTFKKGDQIDLLHPPIGVQSQHPLRAKVIRVHDDGSYLIDIYEKTDTLRWLTRIDVRQTVLTANQLAK